MLKHKKSQDAPKFAYSINTFISTFVTAYILVSILKLLTNLSNISSFTSIEFIQDEMAEGTLFLHVLLIAIFAIILTLLEYRFVGAKITAHVMFISAFLLSIILLLFTKQSQNYMYLADVAVLLLNPI